MHNWTLHLHASLSALPETTAEYRLDAVCTTCVQKCHSNHRAFHRVGARHIKCAQLLTDMSKRAEWILIPRCRGLTGEKTKSAVKSVATVCNSAQGRFISQRYSKWLLCSFFSLHFIFSSVWFWPSPMSCCCSLHYCWSPAKIMGFMPPTLKSTHKNLISQPKHCHLFLLGHTQPSWGLTLCFALCQPVLLSCIFYFCFFYHKEDKTDIKTHWHSPC